GQGGAGSLPAGLLRRARLPPRVRTRPGIPPAKGRFARLRHRFEGLAGCRVYRPPVEWPISTTDVLEARRRIAPHLSPTPLRRYAPLDAAVGSGIRVFVKHENHQPTNAFKARN